MPGKISEARIELWWITFRSQKLLKAWQFTNEPGVLPLSILFLMYILLRWAEVVLTYCKISPRRPNQKTGTEYTHYTDASGLEAPVLVKTPLPSFKFVPTTASRSLGEASKQLQIEGPDSSSAAREDTQGDQ